MLLTDPRLPLVFTPATKRRFFVALVGSVLVSLVELAGVVAMMPLMLLLTNADPSTGVLGTISDTLGHPPQSLLAGWLAALVCGCFAAKAVIGMGFRWWMSRMLTRQEIDTSVQLLQHYVRMPYINHVERGTSDLMATMNDAVSRFYNQVVSGAFSAATEFVSIIMIVVGLLIVSPIPTLALLLYFAVAMGGVQIFVRRRMAGLGEKILEYSLANYRATFQVLHGIKEIKLRHNASFFIRSYRRTRLAIADIGRMGNLLSEFPKYITELVFIAGIAVAVVIVFAGENRQAGVAILGMFVAAGFRLMPSTTRLMASLNTARMGLPSADRVLAEVEQAHELEESEKALEAGSGGDRLPFRESICLEDVHFRYPTSTDDVLRGITLSIPKGWSVGFVGGSGAGKSTLVDVILGLHEPRGGRVLVDGTDIAPRLVAWQRSLAMVPQEVYLLDGTLRENIAFGLTTEQTDGGRIDRAVAKAQLQPLVDELPQGLDSDVGERGGRLSGGQRQRIGIARALYHDPQVLVLDEATSALDNVTEKRITETIASLSGSVTVLVVAHRLSTVRHCDMIVFMKDGRIEAADTFEEVQRLSPDFAHLVELGSLNSDAESGAQ